MLKPGGQVVFLEPHQGAVSWNWLWRQRSGRLLTALSLWRVYSGRHRRFTSEQLEAVFVQAGFSDVETALTLGGFGLVGRAQKK